MKIWNRFFVRALVAAVFVLPPIMVRAAQEQPAGAGQKTFASPEAATKALHDAVEAGDKSAIRDIFGPDYKQFLTGDPKQDAANFKKFSAAMTEKMAPVADGDSKITFEIGARSWPFPIPLVKTDGQWFFDTKAGKQEIIDRHVGKDELHAIGICRAVAAGRSVPGVPGRKPIHGYLFKSVAPQGAAGTSATLVAYPRQWGRSGILTFAVGKDGKVYKSNFGEDTAKTAAAMKRVGIDAQWDVETDEGVDLDKAPAAK